MNLLNISIRKECEVRPNAFFVAQGLVGCAGKPKSVRGFVVSIVIPWIKRESYFDGDSFHERKGWCFPVLSWWFRFNAFNILYTDIKAWWKPVYGSGVLNWRQDELQEAAI